MFHSYPDYKDRIIPVEVHINTPMEGVEPMYEYIPQLSKEFSGPPSSGAYMPAASVAYSFNRYLPSGSSYKTGWTPLSDNDAYADSMFNRCELDENAIATVAIKRNWDESTRTVSGTVTVNFEESPGNGDYRIGLYVVEDSIQGPFPSYLQWSDYAFPESCDSSYVFEDVLRDEILAGSIWGKSGIIPSSPIVGTDYTVNFSYTVPAIMYDLAPRLNHLSLVGFVTSYLPKESGYSGPHGEIYNAEEVDLVGDDVNLSMTDSFIQRDLKIIQNESLLELSLAKGLNCNISLYNLLGKKLKSIDINNSTLLEKIDLSNISSQTIILNVKSKSFNYTKPLIIRK